MLGKVDWSNLFKFSSSDSSATGKAIAKKNK
jgi:hypothetical protein